MNDLLSLRHETEVLITKLYLIIMRSEEDPFSFDVEDMAQIIELSRKLEELEYDPKFQTILQNLRFYKSTGRNF